MSVTIQFRRDAAANWVANNPILNGGELGIESDTAKGKLGDGSTAWNALPYWNVGGGVLTVNGQSGAITLTAASVGADAYGAAATAQSNAETFATAAVGTETTRAEAAETARLPFTGGSMIGPLITQTPNVVFDGDSLTIGVGALPFDIFPHGGDYPSQVVSSLDPRGTYANVGVGGETIATMLTNAPTAVDSLHVTGANNIVVICGGSNDIWISDINPYSLIVEYCQARTAAGWKVIVGTIGPRNDTLDTLPADFETVRLACNASIRANWATFANGIADWGNDPVIGVTSPNGPANDLRYYNGDGAHLTTKGYAIRAKYALAALAKLGVGGSYRQNVAPQVADVWLPANQLFAVKGSPTLTVFPGTIFAAWSMPHGSDTQVVGDFVPPLDWENYAFCPVYSRTGSASGSVAFASTYYSALNVYDGYGTNMPGAGTMFIIPSSGEGTVGGLTSANGTYLFGAQAPPVANAVSAPAIYTGYALSGIYPRIIQKPNVQRTGTDSVNDTCTDAIYLLGIYVFRVT